MITLTYKGSIEYSKDDNMFLEEVLGLDHTFILYGGISMAEVIKDFENG